MTQSTPTDHTLSELWDQFLTWVAIQPGVADVENLFGTPGQYFAGLSIDGTDVSVTMSITQ